MNVHCKHYCTRVMGVLLSNNSRGLLLQQGDKLHESESTLPESDRSRQQPQDCTWSPHFFLAMYYGARLEGQSTGVGTKCESGVSVLRGVSPYVSVSGTNLAMRRFCLRNIFQQPPLSVKCQFSIEEQESQKKTAASAFCLPFIWTHWKWHEAFV